MKFPVLLLVLWTAIASMGSSASATVIKWQYDASYSDGSSASGSFLFNAETSNYSNIAIAYIGNGTYPDATFDTASSTVNEIGGIFYDSSNAPFIAGSVSLFFDTFPSLGDVNNLERFNFVTDVALCSNNDCTGQGLPFFTAVEKSLIGQVQPIPLSATLPLAGAGLIVLGAIAGIRRRKHTQCP